MRQVLGVAGATLLCGSAAFAGGVERSTQSTAILFEPGNYVELSFSSVSPSVSGTQLVNAGPGSLAGSRSGDMAGDYDTWSLGVKTALTDRLDLALVLDQPVGGDIDYFSGATGYLYGVNGGSTATLDASALTAMLRYRFDGNISIFGGIRRETAKGEVRLFNGYTLDTSTETDYGYLIGVAWEKPEIAARIALTYNSEITHGFAAKEGALVDAGGGVFVPIAMDTRFETTVPQSVNLEFQTGVAKDTLLFGSVRWVDWTAFEIAPVLYEAGAMDALVDYDHDTITYNLGLGHRFNETWSGAVTASYEPSHSGYSGNLGPTNGATSVGVAATYTRGPMKITGGARYIWIGDALTEAPLPFPPGNDFSKFKDNSGVALGMRIAYSF